MEGDEKEADDCREDRDRWIEMEARGGNGPQLPRPDRERDFGLETEAVAWRRRTVAVEFDAAVLRAGEVVSVEAGGETPRRQEAETVVESGRLRRRPLVAS